MSIESEGHSRDKVVKMLSREDMIAKLRAAGLYGVSPPLDQFLKDFAGRVAETERGGEGLALAWVLAEFDPTDDYSPEVKKSINGSFETAIDAVTTDKDVAVRAKQTMQQVRGAAQKK